MQNDPWHNVLEFGFTAGQKVADLGSGSGFYAAALAQAVGQEGRVIAIDIDPISLARLKNQALLEGKTNLEVLEGDFEEKEGTHIRTGWLDGALFTHTFARLKDRNAALAEAKRIVKKGGKICFVEHGEENPSPAAEAAGLQFVRAFDAGSGHRGLIFKNQ